MRGVGPPSRAWEARVIAVIRHPQSAYRISFIGVVRQDINLISLMKKNDISNTCATNEKITSIKQ